MISWFTDQVSLLSRDEIGKCFVCPSHRCTQNWPFSIIFPQILEFEYIHCVYVRLSWKTIWRQTNIFESMKAGLIQMEPDTNTNRSHMRMRNGCESIIVLHIWLLFTITTQMHTDSRRKRKSIYNSNGNDLRVRSCVDLNASETKSSRL